MVRTSSFWCGCMELLLAVALVGAGSPLVASLPTVLAALLFALSTETVARQRAEDRAPNRSIQWADFKHAVIDNCPYADEPEAIDYALDLAFASAAAQTDGRA